MLRSTRQLPITTRAKTTSECFDLKLQNYPKSHDNDLDLTQGGDWWLCGSIQKESEEAAGEISISCNHLDLVIGDIDIMIW